MPPGLISVPASIATFAGVPPPAGTVQSPPSSDGPTGGSSESLSISST